MRIIAGSLRSRTLQAPPGVATRPTSDRLRETLFNVLAPRIDGAAFLDLYAGSGAVGIEALSRGAAHVTFVERAPVALGVLRGNLRKLGLSDGFRIDGAGVGAWLRKAKPGHSQQYDIVFLDPPWNAAEEYAASLSFLGRASQETGKKHRERREVSGHDFSRAEDADQSRRASAPEGCSSHDLQTCSLGSVSLVSGLLAPGALIVAEHRRKEKLADNYGGLRRTRLLEQGDAALSFFGFAPSELYTAVASMR